MNLPANSDMSVKLPAFSGIKIVVNGGSDRLDSAYVPISWSFDPDVATLLPTHLLIIVQDNDQIGDTRKGDRYTVRVADGQRTLPFYSPGAHRLTVLAFSDPSYRGSAYSMAEREESTAGTCKKLQGTCHRTGLASAWIDCEKAAELASSAHQISQCRDENYDILMDSDLVRELVAVAAFDVEIPREFFVEQPTSGWYRWATRWAPFKPRNECSYRALMIWACTAQPFLFVIGHSLKYMASAIMCVMIPLLRLLTFYVGFRPVSIFSDLGRHWVWRPVDWFSSFERVQIRKFRNIFYGTTAFRLWNEKPVKRIPLTLFEVTSGIAAGCLLTWILDGSYGINTLNATATLHLVLPLMVLSSSLLAVRYLPWKRWSGNAIDHIEGKLEKRAKKAAAKTLVVVSAADPRTQEFREWLVQPAGVSSTIPGTIVASKTPFEKSVVYRLRTTYTDIKKLACRPFAR